MNSRTVIAHLDATLKAEGFQRIKATWNRKAEGFVDVIDVQISKSGNTITINVGVFHPSAYSKCWGGEVPRWVQEPFCTVRTRVGELIDGKDVWWRLDDVAVAKNVVAATNTHALPFLSKMHSVKAMTQFLVDTSVVRRRYPPPIIYLAILRHEQGERDAACALLRELRAKTSDAWKGKIDDIAGRLACAGTA
jgi:hypothetical protein